MSVSAPECFVRFVGASGPGLFRSRFSPITSASQGGRGHSLNPAEDNQISNQTVRNGCLQSAGRNRGALPCPNAERLQMRSLNCVPEDVSCARLDAVAPSPFLRVESCRNMEIAAYCLGGEAICHLNRVMGFRKVKLGRSVSHAAALALVCDHWRERGSIYY